MAQEQSYESGKIKPSFLQTLHILKPYVSSRFMGQLKSVWVIIVYLLLFQLLILGLPIVYSLMIGFGILIVIVGLMFFMEGLMLGLMPFGEVLGAKLPVKSTMPVILGFAFILGIGATFAEPAIAVLKAAGAGVQPEAAPLLYSLLNEFSGQLVMAVGAGVGVAVLLGVLRILYGWSLKLFIIPIVMVLGSLTIWAHFNEVLNPIIGLAWDCGAVTTGPVTVPLVLALGIGVSRAVNTGDSSNAGFGIVTLASLLPVFAVLLLGVYHYSAKDYYGQIHSQEIPVEEKTVDITPSAGASINYEEFTLKEVEKFKATGELPGDYSVSHESEHITLSDGKIIVENPRVIYQKEELADFQASGIDFWDSGINSLQMFGESFIMALQAIIPLCLFLFIMLRFVLREKIPHADELSVGIVFAVIGMAIFGMGISLGLTPLGSQVGSNLPSAFTQIQLWGLDSSYGPLFGETSGKVTVIIFGFFLGYGATLAEPALNALGATVEKITVGSFKKSLLMQTVAIGVGMGIALGVLKIAYDLPLSTILVPLYFGLLILTLMSSEAFVNFGWDSAGVTTGPITVPLVLAMGLGIGANIPGVIDGFGVLAMASVMPIITVLTVGLIVVRANKKAEAG